MWSESVASRLKDWKTWQIFIPKCKWEN